MNIIMDGILQRCTNIDLRPEAITAVCPADLIPIYFLILLQTIHIYIYIKCKGCGMDEMDPVVV